MKSAQSRIDKLKRPPSLPNWVRLNARRRDDTARRITRFALSNPKHALAKVYQIVADYVTFKHSRIQALKCLQGIPNPAVRKLGREILDAILPELDRLDFNGIQVFHDMCAPYPIGRGMMVPVKPTFVVLENQRLTPVFVIGWTQVSLDDFQVRLMMTIIHNAILTQEGFEGSDAIILFTPRIKNAAGDRYVKAYRASNHKLLSDSELQAQFETFGNALEDAVIMVFEELARRGE